MNHDPQDNTSLPTSIHHSPDCAGDEGGTLTELLRCAEEFERRTSAPNDVEEWRRAQEESLLHWALQRRRMLSENEFEAVIGGFEKIVSGLEHAVWAGEGPRVFKITIPPVFGLWEDLRIYVQNIIWNNAAFGDDMRLEGVYKGSEGASLVMSQRFIQGTRPSEEQVAAWFQKQDCQKLGTHRWKFPNGTIVTDAHTGNLILMEDGAIIPIDLQIQTMCHPVA